MEKPEELFQKKQATISDDDLRNLAKQSYVKVLNETDLLKKLQLLLFALQQLVKIKEKKSADHSNVSIYSKKFYDLIIDYSNSKQDEVDKCLKPMQSCIEVLNSYSKENPTEKIYIKESHSRVIGMAKFIKQVLMEREHVEFTIYEKELQKLIIKLDEETNNISINELNEFVTKLCRTINEKLSLLIKHPLPTSTYMIPIIGGVIVRIISSINKGKYINLLDKNNQQLLERAIQFLRRQEIFQTWGWEQDLLQRSGMKPPQSAEYMLSDSKRRKIAKELYQESFNETNLLKRLQLLAFALRAIVKVEEKTEGDDDEVVSYSTTFQELAKSYFSSASKQEAETVKDVLLLIGDVFIIMKRYPRRYATKVSSIQSCYLALADLKFAHESLEELLLRVQYSEDETVQILSNYYAVVRLITNLTDENKAIDIAKINATAESLFSKVHASLSSIFTSALANLAPRFILNDTIMQDITNFFEKYSQILNEKNVQYLLQLKEHMQVIKKYAITEDDKSTSTESKVEDDKLVLSESIDESFRMVKNAFPHFNKMNPDFDNNEQANLTQRSIFEQFLEQLTKYIEVININRIKCTIEEYKKALDYCTEVLAFFRFFRQDMEILKKSTIVYKQIFTLTEESASSNLIKVAETLNWMGIVYCAIITSKFSIYLHLELEQLVKSILPTTSKMANSTEDLSIRGSYGSCLELTTEQQSSFDSMCVELLEALGMFNKIINFMCSNKIESFPENVLSVIRRTIIPFVDRLFYLGIHLENWPQIDSLSEVFRKVYNIVRNSFSTESDLEIIVKKSIEIEHIRANYCYKRGAIDKVVDIFLRFIRNEVFDDIFLSNLEKYLITCGQYFNSQFFKENFLYLIGNLAIIGDLLSIAESQPNIASLLVNFYNELFHHFKKENLITETETLYSSLINILIKIPNKQTIKVANEAAMLFYGLNISALNFEPYLSNKIIQNLTESKDSLTKTNLSTIAWQQGQWLKIETITGIWYGLVITETDVVIPAMQRHQGRISRKIFIDELAKILKDKNPDVIVVADMLFLRPSEAFLNQLSGQSSDWRMSFLAALTEKMRPQDEARIKFNPEKKLHRKGDFSQPLFNERKPKKSSSGKSAKLPKPNVGKASKKEKAVAKKSESPKKIQQLPKPSEYTNPRVEEFLANPPRIVTTTKKVRKPATPSQQTSTPASSSTKNILTTLSSPDIRHETQEAILLTKEKEVGAIAQPEHPFLKAATHFRQQLGADLGNAKEAKDNQDIAIQKLNFQIDILQFILALYAYSCQQPKTTQYENYRKSWERIRRSLAYSNAELAGFQEMAKLITDKFPFSITALPEDLITFNQQLERLILRDFSYDYGTPEECRAVIGKQFTLMKSIIKPFSTDPKTLLRNFSTGADHPRHSLVWRLLHCIKNVIRR